jgi:hypothetical protein
VAEGGTAPLSLHYCYDYERLLAMARPGVKCGGDGEPAGEERGARL